MINKKTEVNNSSYSNNKVRKNLLLDSVTIDILESYSKSKDGTNNISSAIRSMAREYIMVNVDKDYYNNGDEINE